ncbi:unnamed protein product [Vitrella brassicaformis CCMP3155]|uniref:tRNA/rRNA methyltransferase SpoU type domain-containing protein n=1 Tax=Vitrella brassicaformis (strain CCMP3155) TaxID=1169540 RepID=A0A0G4EX06_VITBC|nr:unnamed protein product [Vitrella brassicaformis CCMP3155]|eukprot:CEM03191.1 unnamed protein product [Vitrella brassicaformis CCMP3155]
MVPAILPVAHGSSSVGFIHHSGRPRLQKRLTALQRARTRRRQRATLSADESWEGFEYGETNWFLDDGGSSEVDNVAVSMHDEPQGFDYESAVEALSPLVSPDRLERLQTVISQRTNHCQFVFEAPTNPNNVWACLRTLDSFGIQHTSVIRRPGGYDRQRDINGNMNVALGSSQWLSMQEFQSASEAIGQLKDRGVRVYASDLQEDSTALTSLDVSQPFTIVLGNERTGISEEMRGLADETFFVPMRGFAESFNLSVACAVTCAYLSQMGGLKWGDLSEGERAAVMTEWLMRCVPGSQQVLERKGLRVPERLRRTRQRLLGCEGVRKRRIM